MTAANGDGTAPATAAVRGDKPPVLQIRNLSKAFSGNAALLDFNLSVHVGEVHVLVGANGSGKSTVIKILSGFHTPDEGGKVRVGADQLEFGSADHAYQLGCRFVHQDLGLVDSETVLNNLHFGVGFPTRLGAIRGRSAISSARQHLSRVGLDIDPRVPVGKLAPAERTGVAVARAIQTDPAHPARLLVMDEPTATLPADDAEKLLGILRRAAANGIGILFVTHRLDEVFRIGDNVTVLRDGLVVGRSTVADIDRKTLIEMLTGGKLDDVDKREQGTSDANRRPLLAVSQLSGPEIADVSFTVDTHEVVGVAGITGSGRETLLGTIFGAVPRTSGDVEIDSQPLLHQDPGRAMRHGLGYLPADRKSASGIMSLDATENLTLADLRPFWRRGRLSRRRERAEATNWFRQLDVRPADAVNLDLGRFSGGNQQKILLAKWIRCRPKVLLLNEPTQGVDVGAKAEIHRRILQLASDGVAILVSSSDLEELEGICSRVLVMQEGKIAVELAGTDVEVRQITRGMMGEPRAHNTPGSE